MVVLFSSLWAANRRIYMEYSSGTKGEEENAITNRLKLTAWEADNLVCKVFTDLAFQSKVSLWLRTTTIPPNKTHTSKILHDFILFFLTYRFQKEERSIFPALKNAKLKRKIFNCRLKKVGRLPNFDEKLTVLPKERFPYPFLHSHIHVTVQ